MVNKNEKLHTKSSLRSINRGFTMIEMALSVAIIVSIAGMSVPIYQSFQNRNNLDIAIETFAQSIRRAQTLSRAVDGDTVWGVYVSSGSITLFKGASYATRDISFDEVFSLSTSLLISGTSEYVFEKLTGNLTTAGTLTITSSNNETKEASVNSKGMVSY